MSFEWIHMRVQEEKDRRQREALARERLPPALEELGGLLKDCVDRYTESFGAEAAAVEMFPSRIKVVVREQQNGEWQPAGKVEVLAVSDIPGFRVERGEYSMAIEVGILPSDRLYYRDCEQDKYLTVDELTRRILDRALFPRLRE